MPRKFRKPKKRIWRKCGNWIPQKLSKKIKPKKVCKAPKEFNLSGEDKVIYVYDVYENGKIAEIVNVSYQLLIDDNWITILRFDSEHGFLHGHMRISINDPTEVAFTAGVKKKGDPHTWLTWAMKRIRKSYLEYKRGFLKRSKLIDKKR